MAWTCASSTATARSNGRQFREFADGRYRRRRSGRALGSRNRSGGRNWRDGRRRASASRRTAALRPRRIDRSRSALLAECDASGGRTCDRARSRGDSFPGWKIPLETPAGPEVLESDNVILATGSIDRGLAFDGNRLPGVMTGSGLRRLIGEFGVLARQTRPDPGRRSRWRGDRPRGAHRWWSGYCPDFGRRGTLDLGPGERGRRARACRSDRSIPPISWPWPLGANRICSLRPWAARAWSGIPAKAAGPHIIMAKRSTFLPASMSPVTPLVSIPSTSARSMAHTRLSRLAQSLGLVSEDDVAAIAAKIVERRPNRMDYLGSEPLHRQPWLVPLEVKQ